jgi:hypothetical protein
MTDIEQMQEWTKRAYATVNMVYRPKQPSERPAGGAISVEVDWNINNVETGEAAEALTIAQHEYFIEHKEGVTEDDVKAAWRVYYKLHLRSWSGVTPIHEQKELDL